MCLYGNVVFSGEACAVLKEYNREQKECVPHILFVYSLTTDVAFYILNNPVCGVISEESSFATHGANILRCHYNNSKNEIVWISGIKYSDVEDFFEEKVTITSDGNVGVLNNKENINCKEQKISDLKSVTYVPLAKRSILDYNISDKSCAVCYWPHRQFNVLTFSIMREGLSKNLHFFGITDSNITLDINGNIWFKNAPMVSELCKIAKNSDEALPILLKQIDAYSKIYARLQSSYKFTDLTEMLIDYFSVFILFHDTYEDVLVDADSFFRMYLKEDITYELMNLLMCCKLDEWMLKNSIILEKRKNLLSNEKIVPLPQFSIIYDVENCIVDFHNFLVGLGLETFWYTHKNKIEFYIKFFVAKEWKFVINKLLFTRFSNCIQKLFPNISIFQLAEKNIYEVVYLLEEMER